MNIEKKLDLIHFRVRGNRLLQYFAGFNRIVLAIAFIPSGMKKLLGERFTQIPIDNPIGLFFEGFYQTGLWYRFVGFAQVFAALLLLIPRTSTLGAIIFFPIVLNIAVITWSLNFQGTWIITIMMLLANLYLLCWDFDKLKPIIPFASAKPHSLELRRSIPIILIWAFGSVVAFIFFGMVNASIANLGVFGGIGSFVFGGVLGLLNSIQVQKN